MPFQINTSSFSITYPQCNGEPADLVRHLQCVFESYNPSYIVAVRERHSDGAFHIHAAVKLARSFRSRKQSFLDWDWNGNGSYSHPNIQSSRRFGDWVSYCKKSVSDSSFNASWIAEFGQFQLNKPASEDRLSPEDLILRAKEMDLVSFLAYCSVNKYQMAKDIWTLAHEDNTLTITDSDIILGDIHSKFSNLAEKLIWEPNKTLVIVGEAGVGKTTWAKKVMPKPLLFVSHLDDLRKFRPEYHKAILFDDVSINHLPITSQIHLVDQENPRSIHVRYGTVRIPSGVPKCFTCNTFPITLEHPAIKRRTQLLLCFKDNLDKLF